MNGKVKHRRIFDVRRVMMSGIFHAAVRPTDW